jgi:hypothetical protein
VPSDPRVKVLALIELAVGKGTPPHEAAAAAMAACRKIKAEGLLLVRLVEEEKGSGSGRGREEWIFVDIPFLVMTQTATLYRVARLEPPRGSSSSIFIIPKEFVRNLVMMTPEETRAIGWKTSSVIKSMSIDNSYFDKAKQNGWDRWR